MPAAKKAAPAAKTPAKAPAKAATTKAPAAKSAPVKSPPVKAAAAKAAATKGKAAPAKKAVSATPATVTLKHLAQTMAEHHELPKKHAEAMLTGFVDSMVEHLKAGDRIRIGGFGILQVRERPARMGRNPATGAAIEIKASKKIGFRPAKELKEAV